MRKIWAPCALMLGYLASWTAPAFAQDSFVDGLTLDASETCSGGAPAANDVVAIALRGAKGRNYVIAGNSEVPRLAVRGPAATEFSVFQVFEAASGTTALYSLGQQSFVGLDENTRLFASSTPQAAARFVFEDTDSGYFRIKLAEGPVWMRMNENGYLDFRTRDPEAAAEFCAQTVSGG